MIDDFYSNRDGIARRGHHMALYSGAACWSTCDGCQNRVNAFDVAAKWS